MTNTKTKQTPAERHWVLTSLLFFLGWVFMYADRTILSPVQGVIRDEFMLTNAEVGLISSVFFIIYTAVQIPSGLMGDKWGRTKLICIGFLISLRCGFWRAAAKAFTTFRNTPCLRTRRPRNTER